ncbi:MAG: sugar phosphate isomerase/epimerase [Fimbriimonadales bacterium]|nr:sugar phosphate isomerase/epimerase [Fimbriimonadales bacterium]
MKIGLQLYTMREFTKTAEGFREVLRRAAEMGYQGVQLSAVGCMAGDRPEVDAAAARAMLDEFGLEACCTHRPWDRLYGATDEEIAFHRALGCGLAGLGYPPQEFWERGLEGFEDLGRRLSEVADRMESAGISVGFHNHAKELEPDAEGRSLFDALYAAARPDLQLILDTYWVAHAGADLLRMIGRFRGRLRCVHAKDRRLVDGQWRDLPVGEGELPWAEIVEALREAGTEWILPEQDNLWGDPWESIRSSVDYLRPLAG